MKSNTHPQYYKEAKVTCSCGNSFLTGSTQPTIEVEICSQCHPFFTGEMKFVDTQGRVERFEKMRHKAAKLQTTLGKKAKKNNQKSQSSADDSPKTLKEMLTDISKQQSATSKQ